MIQHQALKIGSVDLVVLGSTTGAVSAAIAAHEKGLRVFVVGDRPYFGEESAGAFELAHCGENSLFPLPGALAPGPAKHALEKALLDRGIPFLFFARPVALLRDEAAPGQSITGLILAHRTALYALSTKAVVDASRYGLITKCPGARVAPAHAERRPLAESVTTMLIGVGDVPLAGVEAVGPTFEGDGLKTGQVLQAFRHTQKVAPLQSATVAALAAQEQQLRAPFAHENLVYTADVALPTYIAAEGASDANALSDADFVAGAGIWVLGNTLPLNAAGLKQLNDLRVQIALGKRVGELAAAETLANASNSFGAVTGEIPTAPAADGRAYRFADAFYRDTKDVVSFQFPEQPVLAECDVLVAGGGTGGAPAGIAAARAGAKAIVLEMQRGLGGVGTLGAICSYYYGLPVGFTGEMVSSMAEIDPSYGGADRESRWNPEVKMAWLLQKLTAAGGEAWLGSFAFGVEMDGEKIVGVLVSTPFGSGLIKASSVIDASGSSDLAAAAGAPCRLIDGTHVGTQGAGLSCRKPGHHYLNSDFEFIDDNDPRGVTHAFVNARAKFVGIFDTVPFVNTRERRQIIGEVELSPLDLLGKRRFPDTVAMAMSNFDSHGFTVHPMFLTVPPDREKIYAAVPYRAFLPQKVSNLLVTGLGMSAHRDALPVVRMQADVQNHGYSAGLAAAMAIALPGAKQGLMREVSIPALQQKLVEIGILQPEEANTGDSFPLSAEVIATAARTTPLDNFCTAVLYAHPEESAVELRKVLAASTDAAQREEVALVLGLMGHAEAAPMLIKSIQSRGWDKGWNFRGMGQFGMSTSRMDALVIALGVLRTPEGAEALQAKIEALRQLGAESEFSHCRAVAIAVALYGDNACLTTALEGLLRTSGMQGHAVLDTAEAVAQANSDKVETAPRNRSLRELYLAKGLYLGGDPAGLGRETLERYASDLRGPYARHAQAILAASDLDALRTAC